MPAESNFPALSTNLARALDARAFTSLTPIQEAVLDPAYVGRDLRLFSQTGSGKTVAVGLVLAPELERILAERSTAPSSPQGAARPAAILIAPTRELASQLARELSWLYAPMKATVCAVIGGTSYVQELRSLRVAPLVIVGTPGRLLDHLTRGSIDASQAVAVVLDEADQMLDMGFREDLEAILEKLPSERRTHLVAATFSRDVRRLADRYQKDAVAIEGTNLGEANEDIEHVAHLVRSDERTAAIVNLLLLAPTERALVFVRTRESAAELADRLHEAGFSALSLSGDLEQRERTRTLEAFRSGAVTTVVATDVAARGLDVPDVSRVIHADPPSDVETFVHRSGRTGRAGRKGTSIVLVTPQTREHVTRMFRRARVEASWQPAPSPEDVQRAIDEKLVAELSTRREGAPDPRLRALAEALLEDHVPLELIATLLARTEPKGAASARAITPLAIPREPPPRQERPRAPFTDRPPPPRFEGPRVPTERRDKPESRDKNSGAFVPFRVTWGGRHGADARRLLAMVCRRGGIASNQIGAIHIGDQMSTIEIATEASSEFAVNAARPDPRDPRVRIEPLNAGPAPKPNAGPHPKAATKPHAAKAAGPPARRKIVAQRPPAGDTPPKRRGTFAEPR